MLEYAEAHSWDTLTVSQVTETGRQAIIATQKFVTDKISGTKSSPEPVQPVKRSPEKTVQITKSAATNAVNPSTSKIEAKEELRKTTDEVDNKPAASPPPTAIIISGELAELVQKAEDALRGTPNPQKSVDSHPQPQNITVSPQETIQDNQVAKEGQKDVYDTPLPLGFEPPPGFSRPAPKKAPPQELISAALPLVALAVSSLNISDPIITHLASTIDNLALYVASNPAAASKVSDVLETAKADLSSLADRIEKAKEEERMALETKMDEQTRDYTLKMMELEMEAQDKLDNQQEDFRKFFDEERVRIAQAYREKLEHELRTQTEIINQRHVPSYLSY